MIVKYGPLRANVRECWVRADNLRLSGADPSWTDKPTLHAVVIETVAVEEAQRRQGWFKRFLAEVLADNRFELVIVEGVQNPHLAAYLLREGWEFDREVMDFYRRYPRLSAEEAAELERLVVESRQRQRAGEAPWPEFTGDGR